jgi:DNA-binding response OmpR family regulator
MYLESKNFRVEAARDSDTALESVKRLNLAFVVLDAKLPQLDGFEVCWRLRAGDIRSPSLS